MELRVQLTCLAGMRPWVQSLTLQKEKREEIWCLRSAMMIIKHWRALYCLLHFHLSLLSRTRSVLSKLCRNQETGWPCKGESTHTLHFESCPPLQGETWCQTSCVPFLLFVFWWIWKSKIWPGWQKGQSHHRHIGLSVTAPGFLPPLQYDFCFYDL
jgi:hypothetical protein